MHTSDPDHRMALLREQYIYYIPISSQSFSQIHLAFFVSRTCFLAAHAMLMALVPERDVRA